VDRTRSPIKISQFHVRLSAPHYAPRMPEIEPTTLGRSGEIGSAILCYLALGPSAVSLPHRDPRKLRLTHHGSKRAHRLVSVSPAHRHWYLGWSFAWQLPPGDPRGPRCRGIDLRWCWQSARRSSFKSTRSSRTASTIHGASSAFRYKPPPISCVIDHASILAVRFRSVMRLGGESAAFFTRRPGAKC